MYTKWVPVRAQMVPGHGAIFGSADCMRQIMTIPLNAAFCGYSTCMTRLGLDECTYSFVRALHN